MTGSTLMPAHNNAPGNRKGIMLNPVQQGLNAQGLEYVHLYAR